MFYLLLAIASSTMVSVCMRLSERHIKNQMAMFMANYAVCSALSAAFMPGWGREELQSWNLPVIVGLGLVSGVLYLLGFVFLQFNMQHNGMVLASTFMKLGVLIPILMAIVAFREMPGAAQAVGILLSVAAIVILHFEKGAMKQGSKMSWLLALLLTCGITDSMANVFEQLTAGAGKDLYLLITFATAFAVATVFAFKNGGRITKAELCFGALLGVPNYFASRFLLLALNGLDAVLVYPMYNVGTLVVITVIGVLLFREALSRKKMAALGLIVLALVLLNL